MCRSIPEPPESPAAAWGTACHQLSEKCLREKKDADDFLGTVEKTKEHEIEVDEELAETAQVYIDYVRTLRLGADWVKLEQRYTLDPIKPPMKGGGTADTVVYMADLELLEVVDLKGGRGVTVEALGNKQARTYALATLLAHPGLKVSRIQVTIVQPRIPHKDGRIRSEIFTVGELLDWTTDLLDAMHRSADPNAPLVPGDHCHDTFCPAAGVCPAYGKKALARAGEFFTDLDSGVTISPEKLSDEQIVRLLDSADFITGAINAVRAYAHQQAEAGVVYSNGEHDYVLVPRQARKKWKGETAETAFALDMQGLSDEQIYADRKVKTPAQIIKLLGKKADQIKDLWSAESSGTNLVRADKTKRDAVQPSVHKHFQVIEGE